MSLLAMAALVLATIHHDAAPVRIVWQFAAPVAWPLVMGISGAAMVSGYLGLPGALYLYAAKLIGIWPCR